MLLVFATKQREKFTLKETKIKDAKKKESSNIILFQVKVSRREEKRTGRRYIKGIFVFNVGKKRYAWSVELVVACITKKKL